MELEVPYKEGYLLFPPQGLIKKKWAKKFCKLFKSSKHGIGRLEVFDYEEDIAKNKTSLLLTLENCVKISPTLQKQQPNVFTVVSKTDTHDFATPFLEEMKEWVNAFQTVAFDVHDHHSSSVWNLEDFEEDNDLYCGTERDRNAPFTVRVIPTTASIRCGLNDPNYNLVVTQNALQLKTFANDKLLYTWPFLYIRKYGYKSGLFTFEAGRKCDSGDGTFQLENKQNQEIFKRISHNMKAWRKSVCKEDSQLTPVHSSSSNIICGDGQLQKAALNMEPGSRTPLPPSPTSTTGSCVEELSQFFESSQIKAKPSKPPRKCIANPMDFTTNEDISYGNYDSIEVRQDAWKTLGVDELPHTERPNHLPIPSRSTHANIKTDESIQTCRKIINQISFDSSENYDTLQLIGSNQPLNVKSNSSNSLYQQIILQPSQQATTPIQKSPCFEYPEYDVITSGFLPSRPADDSHQGYGTIRKPPAPEPDDEYAMVLKPKKV